MPFLLKTHKQQIFDKIQALGFDPSAFQIEDTSNSFKLFYKDLDFHFIIATDSYDEFLYEYRKFSPSFSIQSSNATASLQSLLESTFTYWVRYHFAKYYSEQQAKDPWETLNKESKFLEDNYDPSLFSAQEQRDLANTLEEIKIKVIEQFSLNAEQQKIVITKIDFLIDGTKRQNKSEWKFFCYSVAASIITTLAFDHDQGQKLFDILVESLSQVSVIRHLLTPPPL